MISGSLIQLLDLLPHKGEDDAPIECKTKRALLEDEPEYEALSYVWGDPTNLGIVEVLVEGKMVPVTSNLHAALRRLRLADRTRTLWIDQLCIDQHNPNEKSHQVRLMREIYSSCRTCILWMGEVPDDIPVADAKAVLDIIDYMAASYEARESGGVPPSEVLARDPEFRGPSRAMAAVIGDDESRPEVSWWTRIWTVQEAALPPRLDLLWGPWSLPWERMILASRSWTTGPPEDIDTLTERPDGPCMGSLMAKVVWLEIAKDRSDSALFLMFRWRYRHATDARDKAYALMGLCDRGSLPVVEKCRYDISPSRAFCCLTADLILSEESLTPLIMDPRLEPEIATPGVPRWAYDVKQHSHFNTDWFHIYAYDSYIAHGDRDLDLDAFRERMLEEPEVLRVPGARADVIAHVGEPMVHDKRQPMDDERFTERLNEWEVLGRKHAPQRHTYWEAFGRTLMGDLMHDGEQWVERRATTEDVHEVYDFLGDDGGDDVRFTVKMMTANQVFFVTETGMLGLGHPDTKPGDEVWVLNGGKVPFTLTPRKTEGQVGEPEDYDFGGAAYVHGLMNGELYYWDDEAPEDRLLRIH